MTDTPPSSAPAATNPTVPIALLIGAVAGFASGLFGVGGGIVIVPLLVFLARMDQRRAQALSLVAIVPVAVSGCIGYAIDARVDWPVAALIATGGVVGAVIGTEVLHRAPIRFLQVVFAIAALVAAAQMFLGETDGSGRAALDVGSALVYVALGLVAGVASGLLGVGGGIVIVPVLTLVLGFPVVLAKGTSLAYMVPTAIIGSVRNVRSRHAEVRPALAIGAAGVVTALVAARISIGLDPTVSSALFALLLTATAVQTLLRAGASGNDAAG